MSRLNLMGQKFGRLYVKDFAYVENGRTFWVCVCDCNPEKEVIVKGKYLTNGDTKSCGCLNLERVAQMGRNNKQYNDYYVLDGVVHVKFSNCDEEFLCDVEDWSYAQKIYWYKNNSGYARGEVNGKTVLFHDYIFNINTNDDIEIDHIWGDRLDNRRSELRICDRNQNALNKGLYKNNTSGVTGVSWHKKYCKWSAYIQKNKRNILLGYFNKYEDAVEARRTAEKEYFGEYSRNTHKEDLR